MRAYRHWSCAAVVASLWATGVQAQSTVYIPDIIELSGPGAVSGTNWRDGAAMAIDEINASGGILGRKIESEHLDTQSNPGISRAQMQKVLDRDPYVVLGPIYSGSVKVNMALTQQAEVPQIVGAEAAEITQQGNPWVFRTAFGQQFSMPKIANYLHDKMKVKTVALVWVNNDFGKGGRNSFVKEMTARGIDVVADISTEQGQVDFGSDVIKLKSSKADAVFVYTNEEESARFLIEAKRQGLTTPLFGETTLLNQKVVELAGAAANGVRGHVGLSAEAPVPLIQQFSRKFSQRYHYLPDHNGIKGYTAVYLVKYVTEKIGKFDRKAFGATMKGLTLSPDTAPGVLMEASWDQNGDIDRASFLAEIVDGKQTIVETLPKLKPSKAD
jgi:branched-chain amino acid transport system substrate-binding protein